MKCRFLKVLRRSRERTADHIRPATPGLVLAFAGASVLAQADQHLAFLQSQAAHIEPNVYRIRYASIQYPNLVPVDTSASPFAGQITYYSEDGTGSMEFLANRGNDFPMVSLSMEQKNVRIENLGIGYEYDMPMPFQFLEPVKDILTYKVPGVMRLGGLEIRLPGAERYEDGI